MSTSGALFHASPAPCRTVRYDHYPHVTDEAKVRGQGVKDTRWSPDNRTPGPVYYSTEKTPKCIYLYINSPPVDSIGFLGHLLKFEYRTATAPPYFPRQNTQTLVNVTHSPLWQPVLGQKGRAGHAALGREKSIFNFLTGPVLCVQLSCRGE